MISTGKFLEHLWIGYILLESENTDHAMDAENLMCEFPILLFRPLRHQDHSTLMQDILSQTESGAVFAIIAQPTFTT